MADSTLSDLWNTIKATAEAELKAAENILVDIEHKIIPIAEEFLAWFVNEFHTLAVQLVLKEAQNLISGAEKQSNVVTGLIQAAEATGKEFTQDLKVAAQTTAQQAYTAVATSLGAPSN